MGATIPVAFGQTRCNVLIDTGAMKSCMSQTFYQQLMLSSMRNICRATTRPPRPSSTAECLCLIARLRGEQASAASWEPRPPFEAAEMD